MEHTYSDIEWEVDEVIETDLDGHGTQEVAITGYAPCDEGTYAGHFNFTGTAQRVYPYDELVEIEIEETEFVPFEPEPEDGE